MVIGSSDGRRQFRPLSFMPGMQTSPATETETLDDPFQNDLYAHHVVLGPAAGMPATQAAPAVAVAGRDPQDKTEQTAVAGLRTYRFQIGHPAICASCAANSTATARSRWTAATTAPSSTSIVTCSTPPHMDWVGCCDHDNGAGREYTWWISPEAHRHLL